MESVQQIWCSIKYWVSRIALKLKDVNLLTLCDEGVLQGFNMPLNVMRKEFIFPVKWKLPKQGWVKLNIDGCSFGNPGPLGVGCIIRDDKGDLLCGFATTTGHNSNNYAELMGLLHGLWHIGLLGVFCVVIELDSMLVLNWLRNQRCGLWYMEDYWDEIQSRIAGLNVSFVHCYRECNSVANGIAKVGAKGQSSSRFSLLELPAPIRGFFLQENMISLKKTAMDLIDESSVNDAQIISQAIGSRFGYLKGLGCCVKPSSTSSSSSRAKSNDDKTKELEKTTLEIERFRSKGK
ncbi:uncharacterized protein LOC118345390 [Juglans regia]|uniref:Uncharacterized protein LOC118345390 n=1 Tax=Juglans regia TaxID=51240 RepID=A0A6P9E486_JUGRE|nr:uncharacterized protein LOC118345390 [Juglans regia]